MFESCPQSKCAIAYVIKKPFSGEKIYLAIVFSQWDFQISKMIICSDEITQMCTNGTGEVVILGTVLGSFFLYDLMNIDDSLPARSLSLNY